MARSPSGPPPPPAVQKLRCEYAKRGRLRFSSHRDFQRALERALLRAQVPMAYSAGFHPHPKISFANAAPTGTASEAEYVEISLAEYRDPEVLRQALDESLPAGLDVLRVVTAGPGALADRLEASEWQVLLPQLDPATVQQAVSDFLGAQEVPVQRMTKAGPRTLEARVAVVRMNLAEQVGAPTLELLLRHLTPTVRPTEILLALAGFGQWSAQTPSMATRLGQGPLVGEQIGDPLAPDLLAAQPQPPQPSALA